MSNNDLFADAARKVLADWCTPQVIREIESAGSRSVAVARLWQQLEETGLADALLAEEEGGAGLGLGEIFGVLEQCGAHALPLPLGETMLARAMLAQADMACPAGSIALAQGAMQADGGLHCALVRGGQVADSVLVQVQEEAGVWYLLSVSQAGLAPHAMALDASLTWSPEQLRAAGVIRQGPQFDARSLSLQYANERQQFGRAIGKFQAIQHQLAVMSEHVFAARMAAQLGCSGDGIEPDRLRVAVAKARCSEAALVVTELAHAIHGAIGFTEEYDLQLFTRRLHAWRLTAGSEAYWQALAGQALMSHEGMTLDLIRRITDVEALA